MNILHKYLHTYTHISEGKLPSLNDKKMTPKKIDHDRKKLPRLRKLTISDR